ncbi:MAG: hypothetical protein RMI90_04060, partial [Thermoguttaceae bacterium]|nr:hypothetical protein [Thermoguttaceae bacterium]
MPRSSSSTSMPTMGVKWPEAGPAASPDRVIEQHIRRTRRQVKWVEIFQGLLVLAVVGLAVLFVVAIADHWLVRGGLPNWVRWAIWLGLSGWGLGYFWAKVLPLIVYRIHPLYAAQTIETARPSLRNNLINFLLLRNDPRWAPEPVVQAVEESAARELLHLPPEGVVDRQPVIRWGYALVAVVALFALYVILSPKSPWVSVSRVLWPWADIPAPTRVRIEAVQPGDTTAQRGESVRVSAEVYGLAEGEEVLFYYSTADGQIQNQAIPMKPDQPGQPRYSLPLDSFVARQDTQYYIQAGDARTRIYQILVDIPLVVTADRLVYEYPSYTGLGRAEVRGQGDIRAVEGTKVTIHASANQPLSQAEIDLDGQGRWRRPMRVEGQSAIGELQLRLHPEDPLRPEYTSYLLRAQTLDGRTNRQPNRYMIEVLPDRPPRVSLRLGVLEELPEEIELPRSRAVEMHVEAEDADFGLRRVAIQLQKQGQILEVPPLLDWAGTNQSGTGKSSNSISSGGNSSGNTGSNASLGLSTGQAASAPTSAKAKPDGHQGLFQGSWQFIPAKLGLKPGDVIFYWARAEDTKLPKPNVAETPRRRIVIVEDPPGQPPPDQPPPEAGSGQQAPAPGQQPSMPPKEAPPEQPEEKQGPKQPQEKPTEQGPAGKEKAEPQAGAQDKQPSEKPLQMPSEQEPAGSEPGQNQPAQKSPQSGQNQPGQEKPQPGQKEQAGQENQELGQNSPAGQETQAPGQKEPAQQKPQSGQNQPGPEKAQPGQQTPKSEQGSDSREGSANQSSSAGQEAPVPKQPSSGGQESSSGKQPPSSGPESASAKPPSSAAEKRPEEGQTTTEQPTGKQQTESPSEPIGPKSPPERIDPVANPGKAFEEILRDRAQQETATKQPSAKPAAQPESKPDTQAESNPGAQPKSQPDLQPESKPGVLPESKPGLLPESKPGLQPESKPGSQPESKPAAQPEKQPGHSPEGKPEGKPALESPSAAGKEKPSPAEAKPTPGQPKSLQPDQPGGEKTGPEKGPPEAQEANQPRSGPPGQKPPSAKPSQEPQSPSISKKQSDSRGDQSGDRSGGGQQGGGQQAPQPG